jgi:hypothetical protein
MDKDLVWRVIDDERSRLADLTENEFCPHRVHGAHAGYRCTSR